MKLDNHIGRRFLQDKTLWEEIVRTTHPSDVLGEKALSLWELLCNDQIVTPYYCTESISDKLDMINLRRQDNGELDWTVFHELIPGKYTFLFADGRCLRMYVDFKVLSFILLTFHKDKGKDTGQLHWDMFYVNHDNGEVCDYQCDLAVRAVEGEIYRLLCFIFLSEIDEITLQPNAKIGTRKQGKVINTTKFPLKIINSRWNSVVVRTEKFGVRGHFALRRVGSGRTSTRLVFIEPYEKGGYTRKAGKQ